MLKCTINGREIEVKEGTTIMEAFHQMNEDIAYYCWHPGLSVAGVCRLCMVEIEGNPKLQIACNTTVADGMKINNNSDKVKDSVKWGLDFHLINHPLDCPICDQAGECGLQDQYMHFGRYQPEMNQHKVKKRKVVSLGERVVLDTERCILCSRCVRFTKEVSKTNELGIFNRGDRSEIGTFEDKPLNNIYSVNTVDICPVGALTSKDFRFKQRVWFLKEAESVCTGCATGCNIKIHYNKDGVFRVKPIFNPEVNGHWMCDHGRDIHRHINREHRLMQAQHRHQGQTEVMAPGAAVKQIAQSLKSVNPSELAVVVTAQYTQEELSSIFEMFTNGYKTKQIYHWINNPLEFSDFDGILYRGDKNPNTQGLIRIFEKFQVNTEMKDLESAIKAGKIKTLVVAGPENHEVYPDLAEKVKLFSSVQNVIWMTANKIMALESLSSAWLVPMKVAVEKSGTFVNYKGLEQKISKAVNVVSEALTLSDVATLLAGKEIVPEVEVTKPHASRVKNEFIFARGAL